MVANGHPGTIDSREIIAGVGIVAQTVNHIALWMNCIRLSIIKKLQNTDKHVHFCEWPQIDAFERIYLRMIWLSAIQTGYNPTVVKRCRERSACSFDGSLNGYCCLIYRLWIIAILSKHEFCRTKHEFIFQMLLLISELSTPLKSFEAISFGRWFICMWCMVMYWIFVYHDSP